ncbi:MAG: Dabb family protein [Candidatus Omnitrophica bacterium]|nr:Dabb family protein [Candidatus Omnitrophota bacterium]
MVKHVVIWTLKDFADGRNKAANAALLKEKLEAMRGCIPGLLNLEVGIDFSRTSASGDVVLYSEFASRQSLDAYQVHPKHEAVKAFVLGIREGRWIVDYEV